MAALSALWAASSIRPPSLSAASASCIKPCIGVIRLSRYSSHRSRGFPAAERKALNTSKLASAFLCNTSIARPSSPSPLYPAVENIFLRFASKFSFSSLTCFPALLWIFCFVLLIRNISLTIGRLNVSSLLCAASSSPPTLRRSLTNSSILLLFSGLSSALNALSCMPICAHLCSSGTTYLSLYSRISFSSLSSCVFSGSTSVAAFARIFFLRAL